MTEDHEDFPWPRPADPPPWCHRGGLVWAALAFFVGLITAGLVLIQWLDSGPLDGP